MVARPNNLIVKVRELQRRLYIAAKLSGDREFHALPEGTWQIDDLPEAWRLSASPRRCMPPVKTIGKPYAGNPHVRFERGPQETEPARHRA